MDWRTLLSKDPELADSLAWSRVLPAQAARFAPFPAGLPGDVTEAARAIGIVEPFAHQVEAMAHLAAGRDLLLATPTASGKTLVFMADALRRMRADPAATTLLLFPLKALARDQEGRWRAFLHAADPSFTVEVYDGDTPDSRRRKIKANLPRVLITNPDMLHLSILPDHDTWDVLLRGLSLIVVDEAHMYRGVFGAHVHHVLQRLLRQCARRGAAPALAGASATMGEPAGFFTALTGRTPAVVDEATTARPERHVAAFNPEGSPYTCALKVMTALLDRGLRTIAFTKARRVTELLHSWLVESRPDLAKRVSSYRAGFLPEDRRRIEQDLLDGSLLGVVSTSALEAGMDVGGLDACVLVGYPGSVMSTFQRFGRVGRGDTPAALALVAQQDALDQYFIHHPDQFFGRPFERLVMDPDNPYVAVPHIACMAAETPITAEEAEGLSDVRRVQLEQAARRGEVVLDAEGTTFYSTRRAPQRRVSLRNAGSSLDIVKAPDGELLGTIGASRACAECHPGAVYLHMGKSYVVTLLDLDKGEVVVKPGRVDYYTEVRTTKETEILSVEMKQQGAHHRAFYGKLRVTTHYTHYVTRRLKGQEIIGEFPLDLPPQVMETEGFWWVLSSGVRELVNAEEWHYMGGLHGGEHCTIGLFPLLALSDRGDIGGISTQLHPQTRSASIFIYDGHPGGAGLTRAAFARLPELAQRTFHHLLDCPCEDGCPSCVQSPKCGSGNKPLDKAAARAILGILAGEVDAPAGEIVETPLLPMFEEEPKKTGEEPVRMVAFDLETLRAADEVEGGWSRPDRMGLALGITYDPDRDAWRTFFEKDAEALVEHLLEAGTVVGFNVRRFDLAVLKGYTRKDLTKVNTLDLLDLVYARLGFRLKLDSLAEANLGEQKSGDGLQSLRWVREGRMDLVEEYCKKDVELTWKLYDLAKKQGFLLYRSKVGNLLRCPLELP